VLDFVCFVNVNFSVLLPSCVVVLVVKYKIYRYQAVKQKEQSKLKRQDYNMK